MAVVDPTLDEAIRNEVAQRLAREGIRTSPAELRLATTTAERLDDLVLFRATYGSGERSGVLQGMATAEGQVNSFPNDALASVWGRWVAAGGLPRAEEVTRVSLFLLIGDEKRTVLGDRATIAAAAGTPGTDEVQPPRLLDPTAGVGVVFWWVRLNQLSEVTLTLDDDRIDVRERSAGVVR